MEIETDESSARIFAEYHRHNRGSALKVVLSAVGILALAGVLIGVGTAFAQSQTAADTATASSGQALTVANFMDVTGAAMAEAQTGHISMSTTAAGQTVTVDGEFELGATLTDSLLSYTMSLPPDVNVDMRFVGGVFYVNLGEATENKFLLMDPADESNPLASQLSAIVDQANATQTITQDAITSVEESGPVETLDGVEATPYRVTVNAALIASAPGFTEEQRAALPAEFTYVFFVGPDNLIRKITFELDGVTLETTYTKWGEPVSVTAPTAEEILAS